MNTPGTRPQASLRQKLTRLNMAVSGAALLLACAAFAGYERNDFRQTMVRTLSIEAQVAGTNSASALLFNDPDSASTTISALRASGHLLSAAVYDARGQRFAAWTKDQRSRALPPSSLAPVDAETANFAADRLLLLSPIQFQGKRVGYVRVESDLGEIDDGLQRYALIVATVLLVSLLAAFVLSSIFQRGTARPITQLAEIARVVSREKKYSLRADTTTNADEITVLVAAFNEMLEQIQARDSALEQAREELEGRVQLRTAQLEAVNRELESFTYSVAHDLRAPLRHIQGFTDALIEDLGPQPDSLVQSNVSRIIDSTRRMDQLIKDLLGLAHVGRQELQFHSTALTGLMQDVVWDMTDETQKRTIEWKLGELPVARCDPGLMKLVFQNLVSNAVKYTRPRDPAVIETGYYRKDGETVLFVRDNGVGFNMKYAHKLFGVFERLHRREDFEGTGVGLATVQRIVHKHGGRIWAESAPDQGATFFFTLRAESEQKLLTSPAAQPDKAIARAT